MSPLWYCGIASRYGSIPGQSRGTVFELVPSQPQLVWDVVSAGVRPWEPDPFGAIVRLPAGFAHVARVRVVVSGLVRCHACRAYVGRYGGHDDVAGARRRQ